MAQLLQLIEPFKIKVFLEIVVKLIQLIRRFWNVILFFILEAICFNFIAKSNSLQGSDLINSSNALAGFFYEKQSGIVHYFQLNSENKELMAENTKLNNALVQKKYIDTLQDVTATIPIVAFDSTKKSDAAWTAKKDSGRNTVSLATKLMPTGNAKIVRYANYKYMAARVINNSVVSDKNNYITINKGSADGIKKDMAVVSSTGVVGRVAYVSKHYATVISLLSSRSVSTQVAGGSIGITNWTTNKPDYVVMSQVDLRTKVRKGDTAYTTTYSVYPENIAVGTVFKIDTYKVNNSLNLTLRLTNNFRNLKYVYVVEDLMRAERKALEKSTEASDKAQTNPQIGK